MKRSSLSAFSAILFLVGFLGQAGVAHADIVTKQGILDWSSTNLNKTIAVDQFDPTLGTLQSVKFTLEGDLQGTYRFQNNSPSDIYAYWAQKGDVSITYGTTISLLASVSNPTPWPTFQYFVQNYETIGNKVGPVAPSGQITGPTIQISQTQIYTFTSGLSPFVGSGSLPFGFVANSALMYVVEGGNYVSNFSTNAKGVITADYTYQPVPIPAGLWLLGSGLVGLIGIRRRVNR
jgi:hypothetical protein